MRKALMALFLSILVTACSKENEWDKSADFAVTEQTTDEVGAEASKAIERQKNEMSIEVNAAQIICPETYYIYWPKGYPQERVDMGPLSIQIVSSAAMQVVHINNQMYMVIPRSVDEGKTAVGRDEFNEYRLDCFSDGSAVLKRGDMRMPEVFTLRKAGWDVIEEGRRRGLPNMPPREEHDKYEIHSGEAGYDS